MRYAQWRNPWDGRGGRVNLVFLGPDDQHVDDLSGALSVWADEVHDDGSITRRAFALVEAPRGFPPDFGPLFFDTGWKAAGGLCASWKEYRHERYRRDEHEDDQAYIDRVYDDVRRSDPHAGWRRLPAHIKAQMFEWFRAHPPSPDLAASTGPHEDHQPDP